ncbi:MAG: FkbM family methyltransferase, partial [Nitrospira sp.]|nr:FkbM family methyltransferase [Nitrospira sp.]
MMRHYCTYFDRKYLTRGLALIESLRRTETSNWEIFVVCMDEMTLIVLRALALPNVQLVPAHEIEARDKELLAVKPTRTLVEYYWTMTPTIILRILERNRAVNHLTYLDADLFFFSSPQPMFDELGSGSILIHEHRFSQKQAYLAESNGRYNVGLLSFRRDSNGLAALRWWRERCLEWCFARYENGKMGDQLYLNDWPTRFRGVVVLKNPGGGVGPWNHDRYTIRLSEEDCLLIDESSVIFYHFHSLKLVVPEVALPVAHAHYPLTLLALRHCFVPYLRALGDAHRGVTSIVPAARWGFEDALDMTPQVTFLAQTSLQARLSGQANAHYRISLDDEWDAYCSDQVSDHKAADGLARQQSAPIPAPHFALSEPLLRQEKQGPIMTGSQHDLLLSLHGTEVASGIHTLYVGGAHRFQERALFDRVFPNLEHIYLFEPIPSLADTLRSFEGIDSRVKVFSYALSDQDGTSEFFLTNNDGESSSLLRLGKHKDIFPHVHEVRSISVNCRTLDRVIEEHHLVEPDMLLLDVQGAEYQILSSLSEKLKRRLAALYVEASLEEVYEGAKCLDDLVKIMKVDHSLVSFAPLSAASPTHGNALFLKRERSPQSTAQSAGSTPADQPLISVLVSSYAAQSFMRECLDDLERQTIMNRMEIIVVDASSPEQEGTIVSEYQERYKNIIYLRTATRIGVYAAWNCALKLARGRYITPFSTNDRLCADAYEILSKTLEDHPEVALAYGDTYLTDLPHQTFKQHQRSGIWQWPEYSYEYLLTHCTIGPHPMWRRTLHETVGYFDESYIALGDQDFWIRVGAQHHMLHIPVVTGLYWRSPDGLSNRAEIAGPEERRLRETYLKDRAVSASTAVDASASLYTCSVIIPVWNRCELTRQCLEALAKTTQDISWELIVVDNHSTDDTVSFLSTLGGDVQIIRNQENFGFAKACNQGALAARGKYLVFLNNETIPQLDWLKPLVSEVEEHPEVGIVGSKLLFADGSIQHAGVVFMRAPLSPYHIYQSASSADPGINQRREFQAVTAACMLIRRELFVKFHGFDESFINGFEDVDLCLKVRQSGYHVVYQPRSVVYHLESQTPGRKDNDERNSQLLRERWGSHWWLGDEDLHYHRDGLKLVGSPQDAKFATRLIPISDVHDRAAWAHVAATQAAALKKDWVAVRRELWMVDDWPHDRFVLSWAAMVCEHLQEPALQVKFLARYLELAEDLPVRLQVVRGYLEQQDFLAADLQLEKLLSKCPAHAEGRLLKGILGMQRLHPE